MEEHAAACWPDCQVRVSITAPQSVPVQVSLLLCAALCDGCVPQAVVAFQFEQDSTAIVRTRTKSELPATSRRSRAIHTAVERFEHHDGLPRVLQLMAAQMDSTTVETVVSDLAGVRAFELLIGALQTNAEAVCKEVKHQQKLMRRVWVRAADQLEDGDEEPAQPDYEIAWELVLGECVGPPARLKKLLAAIETFGTASMALLEAAGQAASDTAREMEAVLKDARAKCAEVTRAASSLCG